ncbi:biotin-dependent carboxyltransferase family protein [Puia dinghuensis]|uniref:KipI antagonist n=1 Tax=Puia dinghuensis TaxID=1792502 RepID=A0A8J2U6X9_9BACT|nr:biotin-dependent carboxyltransferase family protein [Puia dinghuensis]GGA83059.1 KipI antagonist [Puia dinghuensis]
MAFSIIKPGLLDTIQDLGRHGFGNWGVSPGGAMDPYAAQVANLLVGNDKQEAVMEIHFPGPQILFEQNTLIAITGADFSPTINDEAIPRWQPVVVRKNTVLHFPSLIQGGRCYLSVHGGYCLKKWLNSYSTNLKAGNGGWHGLALKKGDELPFNENTIYFAGLLKDESNFETLPWRVNTDKAYQYPHEIGFIPGHEWDLLSAGTRCNFLENNFMIHPSSDRMGYQLKGAPLALERPVELVTSAVSFGTVQLLPNGQLIVLMADHQTTGGYPRIAHVITAHLPKLAQLRPSDTIQFTLMDLEAAEQLLIARQKELHILQRSCLDHLNEMVCE